MWVGLSPRGVDPLRRAALPQGPSISLSEPRAVPRGVTAKEGGTAEGGHCQGAGPWSMRRHGDQIDAVAVARAVGQVMPQVRAVDAHTLAVGQHAHVVPVDLLGVGVGFRVGAGPRVTLG